MTKIQRHAQRQKELLGRIARGLTITIVMLGLGTWMIPGLARAAYNEQQPYGKCAYGRDCPATVTPPATTQPPSTPPNPPAATPEPAAPEPAAPFNAGPPPLTPLAQASEGPNAFAAGIGEALNKLGIGSETQRALPIFIWFLLGVLAAFLLVEAYLDRRKSKQLAASIDKLQNTIKDQKNFSRLVLHNINTPLATIKSSVEMLQGMGEAEAVAAKQLKAPIMGLAATADYAEHAANGDGAPGSELSLAEPTTEAPVAVGLGRVTSRWYFLVPVVLAVVLTAVLNWALFSLGTVRSQTYLFYQIAAGVVAIVILGNAVRLYLISREQKRILGNLREAMDNLSSRRRKVLAGLGANLGGIVGKLKSGASTVRDQKIAGIIKSGLGRLDELAYKVGAAAHPLSPEVVPCDIPQIVSDICAKYQANITQKQLTVAPQIDISQPVYTHPEELKLMFDCLIENAIDYSQPGTTINVSAQVQNGQLIAKITDTGTGISQEQSADIFKPFTSQSDVLQYDHEGMGLSLYVCKTVANRLGGEITLESQNDTTTAGILLPLGV